jgi:sugar/nucleoside kinase (ribokinase family)
MDTSAPLLRYLVIGQLRRETIITIENKAHIDRPGGSLLYAAVGSATWESNVGLVARIGEDYPQEWIEQAAGLGFDTRGIEILPETIDLRSFYAYTKDVDHYQNDTPVSHFARLGIPYPKGLLGYAPPDNQLDSRSKATIHTIRINNIPDDYFDATAAHICPLDYLSHSLLPDLLRHGQVNTITMDAGGGYMNPIFWDDMPSIVKGLTAFMTSEANVTQLFQGHSTDLWEIAETLASYGCDIIVIKRGAKGQYVYDHAAHNRWVIPAYPAKAVDTTGAGNAFCGGFLVGYRDTYSPLEAAIYGNISASLMIEGSGPFYPLDAMPGLAQARLYAIKDLARKA